uniref:Uncharacterized protein n=1 Tax=Bracon brevicornis TaxID=1563983 RepID=A0A6V7J6U7_9HYME
MKIEEEGLQEEEVEEEEEEDDDDVEVIPEKSELNETGCEIIAMEFANDNAVFPRNGGLNDSFHPEDFNPFTTSTPAIAVFNPY